MAMNLKSHNPSFGEEALQCIALSVGLVYVSVLRADVPSLIYVLLLLVLSCLGSVCLFFLLYVIPKKLLNILQNLNGTQ